MARSASPASLKSAKAKQGSGSLKSRPMGRPARAVSSASGKSAKAKQSSSSPTSRSPGPRSPGSRSRMTITGGRATNKPSAGRGGVIQSAKQQAVDVGASMIAWSKAHPLQAALAAAAAVGCVAALISFARHRRASKAPGHEAASSGDGAFQVEDLVTSHVTKPPIPEGGHDRSAADEIAPSRQRTTPSHHFRPTRIP